ncbi:hypothetical protein GCM10007063_32990 [Lentibacillus kapialis]|uniref:Uncharacterized protein n=1 Tax=Lentibacillus kapialis TaxID=340214 RepID=A0A917Q2N6_9BACI|nr:hypothetical protein GCM10007063_32990 [Lentibacillus kapialis]
MVKHNIPVISLSTCFQEANNAGEVPLKLDATDCADPHSAKWAKITLFSVVMNPHSAIHGKTGQKEGEKGK